MGGMNSSTVETKIPAATRAQINDDTLSVDLSDGRSISVPLAWYPRLSHGTPDERDNWRLIGNGGGIHWRDLDEDISVENLLAGQPSTESQTSFKRWLAQRTGIATADATEPLREPEPPSGSN